MKKIFLIDNYDSFTYNLSHYLEELKCNVTVKRNDMFNIEEVNNYDGILISPGPGIPDEAGITKEVIKKLKIDPKKVSDAFQSRLPNEAWLKPYTDDELVRLAKSGIKNLVIVTPAFVTDCLETLEEIAMEGKEEFIDAGGESYHYVPCLNDDDSWAKLISNWAKK